MNIYFCNACRSGDLDSVQKINKLILPYKRDILRNGIYEASLYGHIDIVKFIIAIDVDAADRGLMSACKNNHLNVVKYLCGITTININLGLTMACKYNHVDIITYLINNGAYRCTYCNNKHQFIKKITSKIN